MLAARVCLFLTIGLLAACNPRLADLNPSANDVNAWYTGYMDDKPFNVPLVNKALLRPELVRQVVEYRGSERPGTIVVDIPNRFLYLVQDGGKAMRYGIGVGKNGFSWSGVATIGRKGVWPAWGPTDNMLRINPELPKYMEGGVGNPLGARALYLYQGSRDTMFRIHGTNEPWSIGEQVSSGCVRMLNEDIVDLHSRVSVGATVIVRKRGSVGV